MPYKTNFHPFQKGTLMRTIGRLISAAIILLLTGACVAAAMYVPDFFAYYTPLSQQVLKAISSVTGLFPFAVWEWVLVLIVLLVLYTLVRVFTQKRSFFCWLAGVVLLICVLLFLFVALWGVNHWGPSISEKLGLPVSQYTVDQLEEATRYMAGKASQWAEQVPRDENGDMVIDLKTMPKTAGKSYEPLTAQHSFFAGSTAPVKPLLSSEAFSYMGITGIFIPFTGEGCINKDTYASSLPFTMCHEAAHRLTVAAEDEANFCAFLACEASSDPSFHYSGWYSAFVYCYNALHKVNAERAWALWDTALSERVRQDCRNANTHYDQYEGEVQEAVQKVNDVYLKTFNEESGVQSYGEVADLLIAWYFQNAA